MGQISDVRRCGSVPPNEPMNLSLNSGLRGSTVDVGFTHTPVTPPRTGSKCLGNVVT